MKTKKVIAFIVALVMLFTSFPLMQTASAATKHTQAEAVQWIKARKAEGWAKDVDGAAGAQCVDLILAYLDYILGYRLGRGNAWEYAYKTLPAGWVYTKTPSAGDIAVWERNVGIATGYGHVALVESVNGNTFTHVGVNGSTHTPSSGTVAISNATTFIHPDFTPAVQDPIKYASIAQGKYFISNNGAGKHLCVSGSGSGTSMMVWERNGYTYEFEMEISSASNGYKIRPTCSDKILNVYADTVTDGNSVNIWSDTSNNTQWWGFQAVSGGYVIRNVQNPNVCLSIAANGYSICVSAYTGANSQIWTLEKITTTPPETTTVPETTTATETTTIPETTTAQVTTTIPETTTAQVTTTIPETTTAQVTTTIPETTTIAETTTADETTTVSEINTELVVNSEKITVNKINKNIALNSEMTLNEFASFIENKNILIKDRNKNDLIGNPYLGTGTILCLTDGSNDVICEYTIALICDINGDGKITASDARTALRTSAKLETLSGIFASVADFNADGKITAADARSILRKAAKLN